MPIRPESHVRARQTPRAGPIKSADIAQAQAIPPQFLELIMIELKQAGYVESRRGAHGGYVLARPPEQITAGDIIRLINGPIKPVKCVVGGGVDCPMRGDCVFEEMWTAASTAMAQVFDGTTFRDLLSRQRPAVKEGTSAYSI